MTDAALDREIAQALSAQPSPEFLAKVRTRVANEPPPRAWRWGWSYAAAGALMVAAIVAVSVALWQGAEPTAPAGDPSSSPLVASMATPITDHDTRRHGGTENPLSPVAMAEGVSVEPEYAPNSSGSQPMAISRPAPRAETVPVGAAASVIDRSPFPEVIVSPDEQRAYVGYVAALEERWRLPRTEAARAVPDTTPGPMPIVIDAIVLDPLPPLARLEGVTRD